MPPYVVSTDALFESIAEELPGPRWREKFTSLWPHYKNWYLAGGISARPTYLECERALRTHMVELMPAWERMVALASGGDLEARFLSLYNPPPYLTGCSQTVWPYGQAWLIRNYDYSPHLCEKLVWRTRWNERVVIGTSDCLIGLLDGINDSGLVVSLNFGGRRECGQGFGAPMVVRYLLEFCSTAREAATVLRRIPVHMAYNILVLDRHGDYFTAFTTPDGPNLIRRMLASTNHQDRVAWPRHAEATATLERERRLYELLEHRDLDPETVVQTFLKPPLRQSQYDKGYGTLYTAAYYPSQLEAVYRWPDHAWRFRPQQFSEQILKVQLEAHGR